MGCCFSSDTGAQAEKTPQEVEDVNALVLFCDSQQTPSWVPSSLSLPLAEINFLTVRRLLWGACRMLWPACRLLWISGLTRIVVAQPKGETVKFQVALWWSVIGVKASESSRDARISLTCHSGTTPYAGPLTLLPALSP